jgi:outer membrane receptor for ferric coprogen and ferric-rhodotorulic acid
MLYYYIEHDSERPGLRGKAMTTSKFGRARTAFRSGIGITAVIASLAASGAAAQNKAEEQNSSPTGRKLGGVTVTASEMDDSYAPEAASVAGKSPTALIDIPQSVSVVTREQIEDRNFFTIGEAVQQVTGVTVMPFDGSNPDYRARGFVLDYAYDGIPSTFSSGVQEFDLSIYERLEIQRGSTGLFRGSGSPGGTINLVRKRGLSEFAVATALSAGSWNNYRGEFDIGGPVDADGRLRVRAVATYQDREFFQEKSNTQKLVAYGAIDFDVTPSTTIGASLTYQDNVAHTPQNGQPAFSNGQFLNFPRSFQHLPSWNLFKDKTAEYAGEVEQRVGAWSLRVRGLQRDGEKFYTDAFVSPGTGVDSKTLTATYNRRRAEGEGDKTALDAYATGPFSLLGRQHELTVGYSYDRRYGTNYFLNGTPVRNVSIFNPEVVPLPLNPYATGSISVVEQSGFHAQARLNILKPLTIVIGGRISDYTNKSRNVAPSTPTAYKTSSQEKGQFTPSVGAVLHLTGNVTAYASYSDIFIPQSQLQRDGTALDPRVGAQYEAGLKGRFLDGKLNTSAAIFRSKDKNRALVDAGATGFFLPAGEVSIKGFEFEVSGSPVAGMDVNLGYTNLKTEFDFGTAAQTGAIFDTFEPRHLFKGYIRYEPPALGGVFAAAGVNAQSKVLGGDTTGVRQQRAFAIANGQAGFRFNDGLRLFASVNNLFDRRYYARIGSLNTYNFYGEPRNVLVTLRARY